MERIASNPVVNFTNILQAPFLYVFASRNFFLITVWLCSFFSKRILAQKLIVKSWWNWPLLSISQTIYNWLLCRSSLDKNCKTKQEIKKIPKHFFYKNAAHKMLVKLTPVDTILLMFSQVHGIRRLVLTKSEKMVNVAKKASQTVCIK